MSNSTEAEIATVVARLAKAEKFSGAVRVKAMNRPAFEAAFGFADRVLKVANETSTSFAIASGTKFLTALAIGRLVDAGVARLESRFVDVVAIPFEGINPEVTLEHLLSHTSGVYDYYDEELIDDFDNFEMPIPGNELETLQDYLPMLDGPMKFSPGERFSYSNGGYVLLGLAIEALCGTSFQRFVEAELFESNGMSGSGFFRLDALPPTAAVGYVDLESFSETNESKLPVIGGPDGGAFTTTRDIESLWMAFLEGSVLSALLTQRFTAPTNHYKDSVHYGCGLWNDRGTPLRLYIEGADAGVSFLSSRFGDGTISTIVSNTSEGAWSMAKAINTTLGRNRP